VIRCMPKRWGFAHVCDACGACGPVEGDFSAPVELDETAPPGAPAPADWLLGFGLRRRDYCPSCKTHRGADGEIHEGPLTGSAVDCPACRVALEVAMAVPCPVCEHRMGDHGMLVGGCQIAGCPCRRDFDVPMPTLAP